MSSPDGIKWIMKQKTVLQLKKSFFHRFWWIFVILGIGLAVFVFAEEMIKEEKK
jgi:hypothetical protein